MKITIDKKVLLNSINVALLFSANALTWVLGINNAIVMVMGFIVLVYVLLGNSLFPRRILSLATYIIVFFLVSFLFEDENEALQQYFLEFIMMGIVALMMSQVKIDIDTVIVALCFISMPVAPFITKIDFLGDTNYGQWMGVSYGSIKFIVALLYALLFINTKLLIKILFILPLLFYLTFFMAFGSRGAIVGVLAFVLLAYLIKRGRPLRSNVVMLAAIVIMAFVFFVPLIDYLSKSLSKLGVDFYAIDKILSFTDSGRDLDNGRSERIVNGFNMFLSSPIFGNGIAAFESKYKIGYAHNLFVQQLLEGGVLLFLPLTFFLYISLRIVLSNRFDSKVRMYLAFLISCNVVELLFSNYCWRIQGYWYLIGYVIPYSTIRFAKKNRMMIENNSNALLN